MAEYLNPDHPRKAAAVKFGKELRRAMKAAKISRVEMAKQCGIRESLLWSWDVGNHLPRIESAQKLATALNAPNLIKIVMDARKSNCVQCGRVIVNASGPIKRYCSLQCQNIMYKLREAKGTPRDRAVYAERRLAVFTNAVEEMCFTCEPEGLCRDEACALRVVSPLPLVAKDTDAPLVVTDGLTHHQKRWKNEQERKKQAERSKEYWSTRTPEEREAHMKRASQARWGNKQSA